MIRFKQICSNNSDYGFGIKMFKNYSTNINDYSQKLSISFSAFLNNEECSRSSKTDFELLLSVVSINY